MYQVLKRRYDSTIVSLCGVSYVVIKVIRVFQSPAYFLECLATISGVDITKVCIQNDNNV